MTVEDHPTVYVIRTAYVTAAQGKLTHSSQDQPLRELADLVATVNELEADFGDRLRAARRAAGIADPSLSRAAREEVEASGGAAGRVAQLLERRCRRAGSAVDVIRVLEETASEDLEGWRFLLEGSEDGPARAVVGEVVAMKARVVEAMKAFLGRFAP